MARNIVNKQLKRGELSGRIEVIVPGSLPCYERKKPNAQIMEPPPVSKAAIARGIEHVPYCLELCLYHLLFQAGRSGLKSRCLLV